MTPRKPLRIAIAGLGTVGATAAQLLEANAALYEQRLGRKVVVTAVSARNLSKDRGFDMSGIAIEKDAVSLASRSDVDLVVEVIGGAEGVAKDLAEAALRNGKAFVTANKALLAYHGPALAALAEEKGVPLRYEAAVAGGIPIIKALSQGLAANKVTSISGILNGTCNYILTDMADNGTAFEPVLKEAQRLGYAEADPTFDIDGWDAAHKTAILAMMAFGVKLDVEQAAVTGIRQIDSVDIAYARELGLCIRLLGFANLEDGWVDVGVGPALVSLDAPLAAIKGPTNAVLVEADPVGRTVYEGAGAGGGPTASAVLADVFDLACSWNAGDTGPIAPIFGTPAAELMPIEPAPLDHVVGTYYFRLRVGDELGVMAEIAEILAATGVSIDRLLQRGSAAAGGVYVVIITHRVTAAQIDAAIKRFAASKAVLETPTLLRVEGVSDT